MQRMLGCFMVCAVAASVTSAEAAVTSQKIAYKDGDVELEGYLAWDSSTNAVRPGVLIVHEWWGLNDYARKRADMLARLGYVAFALDMYGSGKVTEHPAQAGEWAGQIRANADAWLRRARAGLAVLRKQKQVDTGRIAAIGYCFGGATVLQLAYGVPELKGVVSFHGSFVLPPEGKRISPKILVCHGSEDRLATAEQITAFSNALDAAGADWHMVVYGGARHSFTNPGADKAGIDALGYSPSADRRSWAHMRLFFEELFDRNE